MTNSDEDIDERVEKAVDDILVEREAGKRINITETACEYRVSKFRIYRRLKRIGPRTNRKSTNYKFLEMQKQALLRYPLCH